MDVRKKQLRKKMVWKMTCKIYNRCDLVTVPSNSIKKELSKHGIKVPVKILSNGVKLNIYSPKKNYRVGKNFEILHVGRVSFEKNIDVVIKSFNLLLKERKNVVLTIVGGGPALNSLKNLASSLNLKKNVNFPGYIFGKKLIRIYQKGNIFVTASTMETQGLVILEAMSCGLPVIGVNKYAIPNLVAKGVNGYIAKPFDEKKIRGYMKKLIDNPKLLEKFGKNSVEIAQKHDIRNVINELELIYKKII